MLENHSLVRLNAEFFERHKDHAEILSKQERPHLVLVIQVGALTLPFHFAPAHTVQNLVKYRTVSSFRHLADAV
ncbi:hypothetical protein [Fibrobacter sp. UWP2]|uniref:hypothetical protein n=1 Tax=Fibrobacter sp. UWP2 TaxID=1896216 RepID=UPI000922F92C|nr:hypothetical protein [Fibrobacter sp. UWP2]SHJ40944.1 hypothetical protein SAMN05720471_13618 [Fibrobacter sp. UWP2]